MENKLSVVIITKNEQDNIKDAIKSSAFASEVLVLDSHSKDLTREIASKNGARVIKHEWLGYGAQKNKAVELSKFDWIMVLDADERISEGLKEEIILTLEEPICDGYYVPRLNNFFGKNIRFCGLYPDYSIRLFNKNKGNFTNSTVHEKVIVDGEVGYLQNNINHIAYKTIDAFVNKQKTYASLSNKKKNLLKSFISPFWVFLKIFIFRLGFLEGWRGFIIAVTYARYTYWKYKK